MGHRSCVVCVFLVWSGCVPVQPGNGATGGSPGYGTTPEAQAGAASCTEVFGCYRRCEPLTDECVAGCEATGVPGAAPASRALITCMTSAPCGDEACLAQTCSAEFQTCANTTANVAVAPPPPASGGTPPPAPATAPVAIVGAWASASGDPTRNSSTGSVRVREYAFGADGSYVYRSQVSDGGTSWYLVREVGTYTIAGDQLTISPSSATSTKRDSGGAQPAQNVPLERVTYAVQTHYFEGIQEWNLVLTPPAPTRRDGPFGGTSSFPNSYLLSANYRPQWQWP